MMAGKILLLLTRKISVGNGRHRRCHGNQKEGGSSIADSAFQRTLATSSSSSFPSEESKKICLHPRMRKADGEGNNRRRSERKKNWTLHTYWKLMLLW